MHSKSLMFQESKVYKPFNYPWAVDFAIQQEKIHWIEQEINLEDDVKVWNLNKVSPCEKDFITQVLRLFTQSDVSVGQNYYNLFIPECKNNEIRAMLGSFAAREFIHQRSYSLLMDTLGLAEGEYSKFLEYETMKNKVDFITSADTSTQHGFGLALAKALCNEGIILFASFIMLLTFQRRGLMQGMGKVVEFSIRDESEHCLGMSKLFRVFCDEHPKVVTEEFKKAIYDTVRQTVSLEDKFIDLVYKDCVIQDLIADETKKYIRYLADRRLIQLGLRGNYRIKENPLPWTEWIINGAAHTNFFEQTVSDYSVAGLEGKWEY